MAKTMKNVESQELSPGASAAQDLPVTGSIDRDEYAQPFELVSESHFEDLAELERFMNEPVKVMIDKTTERNAEQIIQLMCNGVSQFIVRGREAVIRRKYLDILARAKVDQVETEEYLNPKNEKAIRINHHPSHKYPFRVVQDDNPRGYEWLKGVMAEP